MMSDRAYVEGRREVRTFADLHHGADVMCRMAQENEAGSYYTAMSSLLLSAFTMEAYLNHLGNLRIDSWSDCESVRVLEKYEIVAKDVGIEVDYSRRPGQTIRALFKYRNALAHGKTVTLEEQRMVRADADPHDQAPQAHWEKFSTPANAARCFEDVEEAIRHLHAAGELGDNPFIHGVGIVSLSSRNS